MSREVCDLIRSYLDHLDDQEYVRLVLESGVSPVLDSVVKMIRNGNDEDVRNALSFIRDASRMHLGIDTLVEESELLSALAEGLFGEVVSTRFGCAYVLGTMSLRGSSHRARVSILETALPHSIEHDPLVLPKVIQELSWTSTSDRLYGDLHAAASSPLYLTRWAALAAGLTYGFSPEDDPGGFDGRRRERLLRRLAKDANTFVRSEATYRLSELRLLRRHESLSRTEPYPTFDDVEVIFGNYLSQMGYADYSIQQLDAFVHYLASHQRARTFEQANASYREFDDHWQQIEAATPLR